MIPNPKSGRYVSNDLGWKHMEAENPNDIDQQYQTLADVTVDEVADTVTIGITSSFNSTEHEMSREAWTALVNWVNERLAQPNP